MNRKYGYKIYAAMRSIMSVTAFFKKTPSLNQNLPSFIDTKLFTVDPFHLIIARKQGAV
jgi:hypothetical protein